MITIHDKQSSERKRLVLLDSHAIIHRAYHALPDFSTSGGEPTGALYGLVAMLLKILEELKPDYIVACRDVPGPTHRHEKFEAYKGTRAKADDALVMQLEKAPEVFAAFGIPVVSAPGFEADDCIGTLVEQVKGDNGIETVIASGDMDTLQLVGPHVSVYTLRKGLNDTVRYDEDRVHERYGFGPEHIVDYKALRGDPSDNIPGIKGIGEKTAAELIERFGSVEDMYAALEKNPSAFAKKVKPRVFELVKSGKKDALFSKELATIRADAPVSFSLPEKPWRLGDHLETIARMCDKFEFRSLRERARALAKKQEERKREGSGAAAMAAAPLFDLPPVFIDSQELEETALALWLLRSDYTNPGIEEICAYAGTEEFARAREKIFADLKKTGRLQEVYEKIEKPLIPVVHAMNAAGVRVDVPYLKELAREYRAELEKIAARVYAAAGRTFNINSPKQLGEVLFDELKIGSGKQKKTATGARTTREGELAKLAEAHPVVADILAYRELQKLLSTYAEKMPGLVGADGRLHATFLQTGTTTGRMASENPNLQNIPVKTEHGRRMRSAFVAEKGNVLIAIDYSQIELRIAAGLSGDKKLIEIFKNGGDIHAAVAAHVFGVTSEKVDYEMRRRAKVINFGILYGMGVNALRANLGNVSREDAAAYLEGYFKTFSGLAAWIEETKSLAQKNGYTETLFGRRRYFSGFKSTLPGLRAQAERMAVNAPIQGTQADIIKIAMARSDARIEKKGWQKKARLLLQVHDELVYEADEREAREIAQEIRATMESAVSSNMLFGVPIIAEVSIGKNWGEMRKLGASQGRRRDGAEAGSRNPPAGGHA